MISLQPENKAGMQALFFFVDENSAWCVKPSQVQAQ